jgi:hypothetical protein
MLFPVVTLVACQSDLSTPSANPYPPPPTIVDAPIVIIGSSTAPAMALEI